MTAEATDLDRALLERTRRGDRAAFDALVRTHQTPLWRLVRRYLKSDADASDVTQLAFVRAFRASAQYRGTASVRSWLYRIAINTALSWLRDHRREIAAEVADDALVVEPSAQARLELAGRQRQLADAIAQLPPKQRLVLELRVFDDLAFRDVAAIADCSENSAKVNFHYAVKRLREILGEAHDRGDDRGDDR